MTRLQRADDDLRHAMRQAEAAGDGLDKETHEHRPRTEGTRSGGDSSDSERNSDSDADNQRSADDTRKAATRRTRHEDDHQPLTTTPTTQSPTGEPA